MKKAKVHTHLSREIKLKKKKKQLEISSVAQTLRERWCGCSRTSFRERKRRRKRRDRGERVLNLGSMRENLREESTPETRGICWRTEIRRSYPRVYSWLVLMSAFSDVSEVTCAVSPLKIKNSKINL